MNEMMGLLDRLKLFLGKLSRLTIEEKLKKINEELSVKDFFKENAVLNDFIEKCSPKEELVLKSMVLLGQTSILKDCIQNYRDTKKRNSFVGLLHKLIEVESFYQEMGGLIGYHEKVLELMHEKLQKTSKNKQVKYLKPMGLNLTKDRERSDAAVFLGIRSLEQIGEIYPVGGAGDRLDLTCAQTSEPLPAVCLPFCGRTLLEGLIRDVQAKEYLFYKIYRKQITTPIALMTSHEKHNHEHIQAIFQEQNWFGRKASNFCFFIQPLVPVVTTQGNWLVGEDGQIVFKPGGHGVIWKLAKDAGVFHWFETFGRKKVLIRQINNPIAGIDNALLALAGEGCKGSKIFGSLSCPRLVSSAEGTLVLVEKKEPMGFSYKITNLEYTDFCKYGIKDKPEEECSKFSCFPSNTNILFVDISKIENVIEKCIVPGMLVNVKKIGSKDVYAGRLESTMQNIADYIENYFEDPLPDENKDVLDTYVIYNERHKTISVTKNAYVAGERILETPESAFYDYLKNSRELLEAHCQINVPKNQTLEEYLESGPSLIFIYHPGLGPIYSLIGQKLRRGILHEGAELQLEIAEVDIENIDIKGSVLITADAVLGKVKDNVLYYDDTNCGRCLLRNVTVRNQGRSRANSPQGEVSLPAWKNEPSRLEALEIRLLGNAEFVAENVTFQGSQIITVRDGEKITAYEEDGTVYFKKELLSNPSWRWDYKIQENCLTLQKRA